MGGFGARVGKKQPRGPITAHTGYVPDIGLPAAKPCTYLWSKGPKPAFGGRYVQRNRPGVKVSCTYQVCAPLFAPSGLGADKSGHGWGEYGARVGEENGGGVRKYGKKWLCLWRTQTYNHETHPSYSYRRISFCRSKRANPRYPTLPRYAGCAVRHPG